MQFIYIDRKRNVPEMSKRGMHVEHEHESLDKGLTGLGILYQGDQGDYARDKYEYAAHY